MCLFALLLLTAGSLYVFFCRTNCRTPALSIGGMTMRISRKWLLWGLLAATCAMRAQQVGAAPNCEDLTRPGLFPDTVVVQMAAEVAADAKTGMPAYCEVTAQ